MPDQPQFDYVDERTLRDADGTSHDLLEAIGQLLWTRQHHDVMRVARSTSLLLATLVLAGCSLFGTQTAIICDGVHPQWVLDARDYDGGGCVETIPLDQAPPGADWTPVCTGYCLCQRGEMYIDGDCEVWPADRPWPSNIAYPY